MKYIGKLYGRINKKYSDTGKTSKDWDDREQALKDCIEAIDWAQTNCKPDHDYHHSDFFNILTNAKAAAIGALNSD